MRLRVVLTSTALAAVPASAAGGGAVRGEALITPQIGTIFWTLLTFVLLLGVLRRFAWRPLLDALETRERQIRGDIDHAKRDREEAQRILEENRQILDQARRERAEAVDAGRRDAERLKAEILEEARRQRDQVLAQTAAQIETEMRKARADLRGVAADLAIKAAERLIVTTLDDASRRKLVEDYLDDLERLPPGSAAPPS